MLKKIWIAITFVIIANIRQPIGYYRRTHRRCSVRKGALRNFAKFTGKRLCQSLFFNKVAGPRAKQNTSGRLLLILV